jgi:ABC-type nitrate/sulfonate/bicarbonate transport system ATPase subunit
VINLSNHTVTIGDTIPLFAPIDLSVQTGEIAVIMGASGVGKTSLLASVATQSGIIFTNQFRVFQESHQLFPWMTVRKNLELVCQKPFIDLAKRWNLEPYLDHTPSKLSGGQRQRFTLIRGLCSGLRTLLCDEPLSALDGLTGATVAKDFREIVHEENLTVLWVTHNVTEARIVGDSIYLLSKNGLKDITREDDLIVSIFTL